MNRQVVRIIDKDQREFLAELARRKNEDLDEVLLTTAKITGRVRSEGDTAVAHYTRKFDKIELSPDKFRVKAAEIEKAAESVDQELAAALEAAYGRICDYHRRQLANSWFTTGADGEILGQRITPVASAAIYAPGGKAAYPSSVLMGVGAASTAGVERIVLLTPPDSEGGLNPAVLFAARLSGVEEIYRIGGAQAIAAAAYGTETVAAVDVIAGPGNIYVTAAKKLVFGTVNIDMLAGPSEIVVIADQSADPAWVAADMLSQAEHDERAGAVLITPVRELADAVAGELGRQLDLLPKKDIAGASLRDYGAILLAGSLSDAAGLAGLFAPEHLELLVDDPWSLLGEIRDAGAVFIGHYSPEPVGDYWAGPNHVLPTGGSARCFSPLGVDIFLKRTSIISYNRAALDTASGPVALMARAEGLEAHARSIEIRKKEQLKT
ncbi:MAG: histidinol dehydrogenase [Candidatus Glassbacteria bacterium]|nr:histidinol dehydrogenase [Candidatus Glassbacteria bacterium]